jgi:hypothetical protein
LYSSISSLPIPTNALDLSFDILSCLSARDTSSDLADASRSLKLSDRNPSGDDIPDGLAAFGFSE